MTVEEAEKNPYIMALFESFSMFSVLLMAFIFFLQIFYHHVVSSKYSEKPQSAFVVIYIVNVLVFVATGLVHAGYLLAYWCPHGPIYDARFLFISGFLPGIAISTIQISIFYLGLERIFCLFIPAESSSSRKLIFICGCVSSQLLLIGTAFITVFRDYPKKTETHCGAMNCLITPEHSRLYFLYRAAFSFVNTILGITICVLLRWKLVNRNSKEKRGLTTRLAITTFFCEFAFNFVPHFTVAIMELTGKPFFKHVGPFSLFFGSLDVGLCAIFYQYSFARLRKSLKTKRAGPRFDAIGPRQPATSIPENLRF